MAIGQRICEQNIAPKGDAKGTESWRGWRIASSNLFPPGDRPTRDIIGELLHPFAGTSPDEVANRVLRLWSAPLRRIW